MKHTTCYYNKGNHHFYSYLGILIASIINRAKTHSITSFILERALERQQLNFCCQIEFTVKVTERWNVPCQDKLFSMLNV